MKVIFSKYAKQELNDAVHYYELEYEGLGRRFREPDYWIERNET
jgi:hypothetical protein